MSDALKLGKLFSLPRPGSRTALSAAGRAGPRRLAILGTSALVVVGLVVVVATGGRRAPTPSHDARMKAVDALPGGLHSTPEQDALARRANERQAAAALGKGTSFTPPMAPSVPVNGPPPQVEQATPQPAVAHRPVFAGKSQPVFHAHPAPTVLTVAAPAQPAAMPQAMPAAVVIDPKVEQVYAKEIGDLFSQWGGRAPRTDVVLPPSEGAGDPPSTGGSDIHGASSAIPRSAAISPPTRVADIPGEVLIPAGRGVYAHPVLALSSDQGSPVVMQADSGPIAGDRMIGTFSRQSERLVIRVNTIVHQGQALAADGVVIAPDTMEAAVASNVDQHYLTRFVLPAAAAFVQGLGQAIATTSNTATVLSPFGGATYATNLNFHQQLGVAAGAAASQIGSALTQAAPKGPTVSLEANVPVGVMFLSNVTLHRPD
ncbi:MAG TPA: hypothetical protein VJ739_10760 [Gemmataceae bacterium]|nr:hypothetical protein [Gemmataceae bacterium]